MQGVLKLGQEIEVRPGIITKDAEGRVKCIPIYSRVVSLFAEGNELQYAVPGGLIGVGLTVGVWAHYVSSVSSTQVAIADGPACVKACALWPGCVVCHRLPTTSKMPCHMSRLVSVQVDPTLTRADRLVGQVLGQVRPGACACCLAAIQVAGLAVQLSRCSKIV